jgi:hypothetical protein
VSTGGLAEAVAEGLVVFASGAGVGGELSVEVADGLVLGAFVFALDLDDLVAARVEVLQRRRRHDLADRVFLHLLFPDLVDCVTPDY